MAEQPTRRRLDRITAADYLEGMEGWDAQELRARRDECRAEEEQLSYLRRLLQGRIDIIRAEQARRRGEGDDRLLDALPSLLADTPSAGRREPRALGTDPPEHRMRRAEDRLAVDSTLARLPDLSDEEIDRMLEELAADEERVSRLRRTVHERLDALQAELVVRYRDGQGLQSAITEHLDQARRGRRS